MVVYPPANQKHLAVLDKKSASVTASFPRKCFDICCYDEQIHQRHVQEGAINLFISISSYYWAQVSLSSVNSALYLLLFCFSSPFLCIHCIFDIGSDPWMAIIRQNFGDYPGRFTPKSLAIPPIAAVQRT